MAGQGDRFNKKDLYNNNSANHFYQLPPFDTTIRPCLPGLETSNNVHHLVTQGHLPQIYQSHPLPQTVSQQSYSAHLMSHNHEHANTQESFSRTPTTQPMKYPSITMPADSTTKEIDLGKLLTSMAEEYFEAARLLAPCTARTMNDKHIEKSQKLVATGLGCLETALKRVMGLDPRDEACIRLRYAGVLFEETENYMEAETTLSKGIELCERNHYYDLKYAMHFLLAKCIAKSNLRASIKALDAQISEAETYKNISWVYAFRFLRATYSLTCGTFIEHNAAVRNLKAIEVLAEKHGDRPIHLVASLMEVIAHLKIAGPEASQNLKSAMASVWSHQTDPSCYIAPLTGLAHILDLACSIREGDPQVLNKLQSARLAIDASIRDKGWNSSDTITIPIKRTPNSSHVVSTDTRMILGVGKDGVDMLMLTFFDQKETYCISCLLYGIILLQRSTNERLLALKYLNQVLPLLEKEGKSFLSLKFNFILTRLLDDAKSSSSKSLPNAILPDLLSKRQWRGQVLCYTRIFLAFCHTLGAEWSEVKKCLEELRRIVDTFQIPLATHLESLLFYLGGVFYQGSGDLDAALGVFQDSRFNLPTEKPSNISSIEQMEYDIAILARLNALSILQDPPRLDLIRNAFMIKMLEPLCIGHANQDIVNAFNLIMVTVKTEPPKSMMEIKHHLSAALNGTKRTNNLQLLSITVTLMFSFFFVGVLGTQAENGAQAASRTAAKSGNPLWMSVTDGMLARCYELHGRVSEAEATTALALKSAEKLSFKS
ncbi:hypothetical protein BGHDH14_bgh05022 [Blumeria hordei DH14]|uniref:Cohesin loading factor n=1 Tax=Blumeria graminis f. sp. hordei (strain DH14) TaxID=546991 RepID=N1JHU1_BLUG1|nr:hypothetical protein BGHDH14_bgh05022 [Blumeria hordei DH14]